MANLRRRARTNVTTHVTKKMKQRIAIAETIRQESRFTGRPSFQRITLAVTPPIPIINPASAIAAAH
jgi:hypothetical protein